MYQNNSYWSGIKQCAKSFISFFLTSDIQFYSSCTSRVYLYFLIFPQRISLLGKQTRWRPRRNYFLNHHIKCSFHRSSTSFPLTNSQGEVEESNGLRFLSAYRLSRRGKAKRASFGARRASRSDEGKHANQPPTRSHQRNIFECFLPCGPTFQDLISECKENVLPVTHGLTRVRLSFCQFCLSFFGATHASVCDIHT